METVMELEKREEEIDVYMHPHPVKFIEDLKIAEKEGILCSVCEELWLGPGFKCGQGCNFLCHESCGLLEDEIRHPLHPNHFLDIRPPFRYAYCDACGKSCGTCAFYTCDECNFSLDTKCASRWRVEKDTCDLHAFIPLVKQIQFTCEFCGEKGEGEGCVCSVCLIMIHAKCAPFAHTIKIADHSHFLVLTYPAHEVEGHSNMVCNLCSRKLDTKYAIYYCQECSYATHLRCASDREILEDRGPIIGSVPIEFDGYLTHLVKDINQTVKKTSLAGMIKHVSHHHELILNCEVTDDKVCDGCMQQISVPFYNCMECNFFLHSLCANLPINTTFKWGSSRFTLLPRDDAFQCDFCNRYRHGFAYNCEDDDKIMIDVQCFIIQEKLFHESHQHPLFSCKRITPKCNACEEKGAFSCSRCDFSLCHRCSTFPLEAGCKFDDHILKLTYKVEDESGEYYCLICKRERDPKNWFYYCAKCDFPAHLQCIVGDYSYIKFGKTYTDDLHQHPLTFIPRTSDSLPCNVCGTDFDGVALRCKECKLDVHSRYGCVGFECLQKLSCRRWQ